MIIDNTFTVLYLLYKAGSACGVVGLICFVFLASWFLGEHEYMPGMKKLLIWTGVFTSLGCLTPSLDEVKTYAVYAITRDAAHSETAQRLTEAALKFIEGKTETANNVK